jgi:hypothetical protein
MAKPESTPSPPKPETAGEAVWPGKEAWKNEPGNRYTPEELREMARHWKFKVIVPKVEIHRVN